MKCTCGRAGGLRTVRARDQLAYDGTLTGSVPWKQYSNIAKVT